MDLLLDTNIILLYGKNDEVARAIEMKYGIFSGKHRLATSIVTIGELDALTKKLGLGTSRQDRMNNIIQNISISDIRYDRVIEAYGDTDHFSQGKLSVQVNKNRFTARNMGKNDLWIAATAKAFGLTLVTTDKDFDHLHDEYINVMYIDMDTIKQELKAH